MAGLQTSRTKNKPRLKLKSGRAREIEGQKIGVRRQKTEVGSQELEFYRNDLQFALKLALEATYNRLRFLASDF